VAKTSSCDWLWDWQNSSAKQTLLNTTFHVSFDSLKKFQKEHLAQGQKDSGNFEDQ
jgi:hypothetical protein